MGLCQLRRFCRIPVDEDESVRYIYDQMNTNSHQVIPCPVSISLSFFISFSSSTKSNTSEFAAIRSGLADFGNTMYPDCKHHRIKT